MPNKSPFTPLSFQEFKWNGKLIPFPSPPLPPNTQMETCSAHPPTWKLRNQKKRTKQLQTWFFFSPQCARCRLTPNCFLAFHFFLFLLEYSHPPRKKKKYNKKEKRIHPHQHEPFNRVWEREKKDKETTAAPTRRVHTFFASAKRKPTWIVFFCFCVCTSNVWCASEDRDERAEINLQRSPHPFGLQFASAFAFLVAAVWTMI